MRSRGDGCQIRLSTRRSLLKRTGSPTRLQTLRTPSTRASTPEALNSPPPPAALRRASDGAEPGSRPRAAQRRSTDSRKRSRPHELHHVPLGPQPQQSAQTPRTRQAQAPLPRSRGVVTLSLHHPDKLLLLRQSLNHSFEITRFHDGRTKARSTIVGTQPHKQLLQPPPHESPTAPQDGRLEALPAPSADAVAAIDHERATILTTIAATRGTAPRRRRLGSSLLDLSPLPSPAPESRRVRHRPQSPRVHP